MKPVRESPWGYMYWQVLLGKQGNMLRNRSLTGKEDILPDRNGAFPGIDHFVNCIQRGDQTPDNESWRSQGTTG